MRLFLITFVAILGCYFSGSVIWGFVGNDSLAPWVGFVVIIFLIVGVFSGIGYLEISKHDIKDKIRMRRNNGSMTPGLFFAALYFGSSDVSHVGGGGMSDMDSLSGNDTGGGGDGGGD